MAIDTAFLSKRITAAEAEVEACEAAVLKATTDAQSYQLDTGQTRTLVSKATMAHLSAQLEGALSRLSVLCNRRDGTGSVYVRPAF